MLSLEFDSGDEERERLCLMDMYVNLMSICGIIPSKGISSSWWKLSLYRLFQILLYALYLLVVALDMFALYYFWGDMQVTTDNIYITTGLMLGYVPAAIAILNQSQILSLLEYVEINSVFTIAIVRSNKNHMKVLQEAKGLGLRLTWIFIVSIFIITLLWSSFPFMSNLFKSKTEEKPKENISASQLEKLVFVIWVPFDLKDPFWYGLVYACQVIVFFFACVFMIGILPLYFNLLIYATAPFKMVANTLKELEERFHPILRNTEHQILDELYKSEMNWDVMNDSLQIDSSNNNSSPSNKCLEGKETQHYKHQKRNIVICNKIVTSKVFKETLQENPKGYEEPDTMLLQCVKLHQHAVLFVNKINILLQEALFFPFVLVTIMMVTEIFQLSLNLTSKYISSFLTCLAYLSIFMWFGQSLMNASEAVATAAYSCHWYERSVYFKRILLILQIRSQIPLQIKITKLFTMSMETLAQVLNTAYTVYNVLLQVKES